MQFYDFFGGLVDSLSFLLLIFNLTNISEDMIEMRKKQ